MAETRILKPGDERLLEAFLLPRVQSSMFLLGNSRLVGLKDGGGIYQGTYAAALEDGAMAAVVAHYWNHMLILQAPTYIDELVQAVASASGRPIKGLIGPSDQVGTAKDYLQVDDIDIQMDEIEYLYSLDLDQLQAPDILSSGQVSGRRIESHDINLGTEWEVAYSQEALGEEDGLQLREHCRAAVERSVRERKAWVLEREGQLVARTAFNTAIQEAVQVGGVWPPPEYRSRGYGRAAVAVSLLEARSEGASIAILFTGEENYPARKAYEALGFQRIGDYRILILKSPVEL